MRVETQKVTVHLPKELLSKVQAGTGAGITETIRLGLEKLEEEQRLKSVYQRLLASRGKHKFSIDYKELRKDKGETR